MARRKKNPRHAKKSDREREVLIGGYHAVHEALRSHYVELASVTMLSAVADRPQMQQLRSLLDQRSITPRLIEGRSGDSELDRLYGDHHQGVVATMQRYEPPTLEKLLEQGAPLVALDRIQDPMNLGAIARTANAFGVSALVTPRDRSCGLTSTAVRASSGALFHTPLIHTTNLSRLLREAKDEWEYWTIGLDHTSDDRLDQFTAPQRWLLVTGSEGEGIRPAVLKQCDYRLAIPLRGEVASLNASAATAIGLYHLSAQGSG